MGLFSIGGGKKTMLSGAARNIWEEAVGPSRYQAEDYE